MRRLARLALLGLALVASILPTWAQNAAPAAPAPVQWVFTSDAHYGITRPRFRGRLNADARSVNQAMVAAINRLPGLMFPRDGGVGAGAPVGAFDFVAQGGDIANRAEGTGPGAIQSAAISWRQFAADYFDGIRLTDRAGRRAPLFVVPGNHDLSNAVGFHRPMTPPIDRTSMVEIYNRMMAPATPVTTSTWDARRHRVFYARDVGGVHLVFLTVWPDSAAREWMEADLARVAPSVPVIVFTHDEPDVEAKHFVNPNGRHDINAIDQFENLLVDRFADGPMIGVESLTEERAFEQFLRRHPNVTGYFHGNSNWNQFYDWTGPDHTAALHTFRVDSPLKGEVSMLDETKLSFQVATLDPASRRLTVREVLWNTRPRVPATIAWGASTTVALSPRPAPPARR